MAIRLWMGTVSRTDDGCGHHWGRNFYITVCPVTRTVGMPICRPIVYRKALVVNLSRPPGLCPLYAGLISLTSSFAVRKHRKGRCCLHIPPPQSRDYATYCIVGCKAEPGHCGKQHAQKTWLIGHVIFHIRERTNARADRSQFFTCNHTSCAACDTSVTY